MKLRRPLAEYLQQVEESLGALRDAYVECYLEEVLTPERANLRVRVRFQNGRLLEINEAVVADDDAFTHLDYPLPLPGFTESHRLPLRQHATLPRPSNFPPPQAPSRLHDTRDSPFDFPFAR